MTEIRLVVAVDHYRGWSSWRCKAFSGKFVKDFSGVEQVHLAGLDLLYWGLSSMVTRVVRRSLSNYAVQVMLDTKFADWKTILEEHQENSESSLELWEAFSGSFWDPELDCRAPVKWLFDEGVQDYLNPREVTRQSAFQGQLSLMF